MGGEDAREVGRDATDRDRRAGGCAEADRATDGVSADDLPVCLRRGLPAVPGCCAVPAGGVRARVLADYGDVLAFENVLCLWNDDEEAYNLVVNGESVVDRVA